MIKPFLVRGSESGTVRLCLRSLRACPVSQMGGSNPWRTSPGSNHIAVKNDPSTLEHSSSMTGEKQGFIKEFNNYNIHSPVVYYMCHQIHLHSHQSHLQSHQSHLESHHSDLQSHHSRLHSHQSHLQSAKSIIKSSKSFTEP